MASLKGKRRYVRSISSMGGDPRTDNGGCERRERCGIS